VRPQLDRKNLGVVDASAILATVGNINRSIEFQAGLGKKEDLISKISRAKMSWRHCSSSRMPA
jgi:hypothetical protein